MTEGEKEKEGGQQQETVGVMGSIGPECNELKRAYDSCFNAWFADSFLKSDGQHSGGSTAKGNANAKGLDTCDALLATYTACVKRALQARNVSLEEIDKQHLGTDKERLKPPAP